jgi:uroporphyrinogen III methyltransferase / synthase
MRILLPQANIARDTLRDLLTQAGTQVTAITSYQTVIGRGGVHLPALLAAHQVDAITFTSSSTVTHCVQRLQAEGGDPAHLAHVICACIGPKTAQTAAAAHLDRITVPHVYTLEGIVESLVTVFATEE